MKNVFTFLVCISLSFLARAATVDTVSIYSKAMNREFKCVVILPDPPPNVRMRFPVVYLLHGYSGNYSNWVKLVPQIKDYADQYLVMIVCPDGAYSSWYYDSPLDSSMKFETYISKEVPEYIDEHFGTIKDKNARAITGLSMGGHGGLFLGFRHSDVFGACGSMSGGVDIQPFSKNWEISKRIGDSTHYPMNWKNYSVTSVIEEVHDFPAAIIFDCGTEDFFYKVNHALHEKMVSLHIPHEYIERPGQHNWAYWSNSVQYQLLYFSNYFHKATTK